MIAVYCCEKLLMHFSSIVWVDIAWLFFLSYPYTFVYTYDIILVFVSSVSYKNKIGVVSLPKAVRSQVKLPLF